MQFIFVFKILIPFSKDKRIINSQGGESVVVISFIPIVIIGLVILIIAGLRVDFEKDGEEVFRNIYHYLVMFATLMMVIGGSIGVFMSAADLVSPAPYYQSFEEYRQMNYVEGEKNAPLKSEEELRTAYDAMIQLEEEQSKKRAINSLIKSFGWIIIPLPIFIYFQRRLKHKEQ